MQLGKFENNVGSVFKIYNNYITLLKGKLLCSNNTSNSKSCFRLIAGSYIELSVGSFTLFNNNKALLSGGAIYADNQGLSVDLCTVASYTGSEKVFKYTIVHFITICSIHNCACAVYFTISTVSIFCLIPGILSITELLLTTTDRCI